MSFTAARVIASRVRAFFKTASLDDDFHKELEEHLELLTADNMKAGMSPEEARRAALLRLGGIELNKERHREARSFPRLDALLQDLRCEVRVLRRNPAFTAAGVLTMALGIGANTAIFSVVNAVLLRPLPYPDSQRLVTMKANQSLLDMQDIAGWTHSYEAAGGVTYQRLDFSGGTEPVQIDAALINAGLFRALGVMPAIGRPIAPEEDRFGGPRVVILSDGFWRQYFDASAGILGRAITLGGNSYTVIGVMPSGFAIPQTRADVLASLRVVYPEGAGYRGVHFLRTWWRLKQSVTLAQAQAELEPLDRRLASLYPAENLDRHTVLVPAREWLAGKSRPALLMLLAAVSMLLLVACANYAGLLLARAIERQQEIGMRVALGASRSRIVAQMLTESLLLSLLGGLAGLALAAAGVRWLMRLKPDSLDQISGVRTDVRVLLFALAVALICGIIFGLVPAWGAMKSFAGHSTAVTASRLTATRAGQRLRNVLVVAQLALALVLLTGAGLLIKGLWRLHSVDPGFRPENLLTMFIQLPPSRYSGIPAQTRFRRDLLANMNAVPGIQAAMISELPLSGEWLFHSFVLEGRAPVPKGSEPEVQARSIMGDYFRTMRIPLRAGRDFTDGDREGAPLAAVVNETFSRTYFPNRSPIGARFRWAREEGPPHWFTIVGVVGDVRHFALEQADEPAVYMSYAQSLQEWKRWMYIVVRSRGNIAALAPLMKRAVWKADALVPVTHLRPMPDIMRASTSQRRFNMLLLGIFAAVALALAAVGIYGVISYAVTQRTQEFGIRMALGAGRTHMMRIVLGHGTALLSCGLALGLLASLGLTRLMSGLLFGVTSQDPATLATVTTVLALVALLASYLPARRAMNADPTRALRYQ